MNNSIFIYRNWFINDVDSVTSNIWQYNKIIEVRTVINLLLKKIAGAKIDIYKIFDKNLTKFLRDKSGKMKNKESLRGVILK